MKSGQPGKQILGEVGDLTDVRDWNNHEEKFD